MSISKRRILRLSVLFVAGAVASVLVAWTVATLSGPGYDGRFSTDVITKRSGQPDVASVRIRTLGHEEWWRVVGSEGWAPPGFSLRDDIRPPSWAKPPDETTPGDRCSAAFGFPMLCLKSEFGMDRSGARWDSHSLEWNLSLRPDPIRLPLAPIWPGLIIDSLFFAALLPLPWLALLFARFLRGRRRLRRGHCPACNYNLLHNFAKPCPECGRISTVLAPSSTS